MNEWLSEKISQRFQFRLNEIERIVSFYTYFSIIKLDKRNPKKIINKKIDNQPEKSHFNQLCDLLIEK